MSFIDTFGFYNPSIKKRGKLKIIYQIVHSPIDPSNQQLFKNLFIWSIIVISIVVVSYLIFK